MKNTKLTNLIPLKLSHFSVIGLLFVLNMPSAIPADAPGNLASEPLQTSATAEPNVMFLLDNSGSMVSNNISPSYSRWAALKDTMDSLLSSLSKVRVSVATFQNDGRILYPFELLDKSNLADHATKVAAINTAIANETTGGHGTILAQTLQNVGRYFANDANKHCGGGATVDTTLTIHPNSDLIADGGLKEDVECTTLFGDKTEVIDRLEAITESCSRSFTIIMSDGATNNDNVLLSSGPALAARDHPFRDYDRDCTAAKISSSSPAYTCDVTSDLSPTQTTLDKKSLYTYINDGSDYLDDIAQAMYEIDLRPDYTGFKNNVTTYTVGFADDTLNPAHADYNPLMKSAADQGGGEYYFATDAASLLSSFTGALNSIVEQTSTSSAVTFNSSTLSSQAAVYQALYNTASWSGELNSYPINGLTGAIISNCATLSPVPDNCWKAADKLKNQTPSNRFIIVAGDTSSKHAVEFKYKDISTGGTNDYTNLTSTDIPQALVADLCSVASGTVSGTSFPCLVSDTTTRAANGAYMEDLVNYIRGDNTEEGASSSRNFRPRLHDLGDIVNSSPIYVGEPQQSWPSTNDFPTLDSSIPSTDYQTWATATKYRPETIYVASNDGMLHGFRAKNAVAGDSEDVNTSAGEEIFSFIPTGAFSTQNSEGLHFLADKDYTHRFYNDLTPSIADVYIDYRGTDGTPTGTFVLTEATKSNPTAEWRTVLLGSQGAGGKSVYLLDVTDPTEYTDTAKQNPEKLVLWEFSDSDADLGFTYSKPTISMMNNGKFAAIFGNGYNSAGCKAKLFVVFLEGGLDGTWTAGTDYFEYDTGTAHGGGAGDCNGMSTPAVVDLDGNGTADRVYAGDLKGNLWAFDLCAEVTNDAGDCSTTASAWGIAHADPLMNANNGTVHDGSQPITTKPVVSLDPNDPGTDNLIIVFGTGQYLIDADKSTTGLQRMYGVRDYDALNNSSAGVNGEWDLDGGDNSPQRWAETVFTLDSGGTGTRVFDSTDGAPATYYGWRIDLPDTGERVVANPKIRNDIVFFNTLIPEDAKCTYGGSGWIMSVNLINGGFPPAPVFDLNGDGIIDSTDTTSDGFPAGQKLNEIPAESTFLGDNQYTPGSDSKINIRKVNVGKNQREGRMSWKELFEDSLL